MKKSLKFNRKAIAAENLASVRIRKQAHEAHEAWFNRIYYSPASERLAERWGASALAT